MHPLTSPAVPGFPLTLRPLAQSDAEAWLAFAADPVVMQYTSSNVQGVQDLLPIIGHANSTEPGTPVHFAVCLEPEGAFVGCVGFHTISVLNKTAEITYSIHPQYWSKGFASAVCRAVTAWGFAELGFVRVQATVLEPNIGSIKVLERSGFTFEGRLRNFRMVRGKPREYMLYSVVPGDLPGLT